MVIGGTSGCGSDEREWVSATDCGTHNISCSRINESNKLNLYNVNASTRKVFIRYKSVLYLAKTFVVEMSYICNF